MILIIYDMTNGIKNIFPKFLNIIIFSLFFVRSLKVYFAILNVTLPPKISISSSPPRYRRNLLCVRRGGTLVFRKLSTWKRLRRYLFF